MNRAIGLVMRLACCAVACCVVTFGQTAFGQTAIDATVTGSTDVGGPFESSLTVGNMSVSPCTINYQVSAVLTDMDNEGLALIGFDLELVDSGGSNAGTLPKADDPTSVNMMQFMKPFGVTNPEGFGGTPIAGKLVQAGGGSNTINNVESCTVDEDCPGATNTCDTGTCTASAPFPVGTVIAGVAQPGSPEIVLTGSFTAPTTVGTYTLQLTALFANAIKAGEDGNPFYATKAVDVGVVTDFELTVESSTVCGGCVIATATSVPPDGAIDARQPQTIDGVTQFGWDSVEITFNCPRAADIAAIGPSAFSVAEVAGGDGTAATVTAVSVVDADTVMVTLSERLEPESWTRITHIDSGTSICLGNLPGDVNNDGTSNPALDLGALIDCINNPGSCEEFQENTDRTGTTAGVLDITRLIDLFNGAGAFDSWTGASIGSSCPTSDGR